MKLKGITMIFAALVCTLTLLAGSAIAAPIAVPIAVPEPTGILAFLGAAVAGIAVIKSRMKK
jgi:hypothetical protein